MTRSIWTSVFELLIALYPPRFRRAHGTAVRAAISSAIERGQQRHGRRWLAYTLLAADLLGGAVAEWRETGRRRFRANSRRRRDRRTDRFGSVRVSRLLDDFGLAGRRLRRAPAFTIVAILTVTLGVGASTAVFSLVDAVLLRPMPYEDPEQLGFLWSDLPFWGISRAWVSGPQVVRLRERADRFAGFAALDVTESEISVGADAEPGGAPVRVGRVSGNLFELLGVDAALGRTLLREEEGPGAPEVAVLTHDLWRTRLGADSRVLGGEIHLDGATYKVVGIMPPDFRFAVHSMSGDPRCPDVYIPLEADLASWPTTAHSFALIGRLAADVPWEGALAQLDAIAVDYGREAYDEPGFRFVMVPLHSDLVKDVRPALLMLGAAVGLLSLLVCANLATLYIGRIIDGAPENALRAALGAGAWARAAVTVLETAWVTGVGGLLGVLAARLTIDGLLALAPSQLPRSTAVEVDGRVLAFSLALTAGVGLVIAGAALLRQRRLDISSTLRASGRGLTGAPRRAQHALVIVQVTIAGILLVGAGLVGRSLSALWAVDPGFRTEGVLLATVRAPAHLIPEPAEAVTLFERLRQRMLAEPGVREAGFADFGPLSIGGDQNGFDFAGAPGATGEEQHDDVVADHLSASPGYFRATGIEIVDGRGFTPDDAADSGRVVVIDEALARRFWPGASALDGTIHYYNEDGDVRIVGVVGHARRYDMRRDGRPQIYSPLPQRTYRTLQMALLAADDPRALIGALRAGVTEVDRRLAVDDFRTIEQAVGRALSSWRFLLQLLGFFSAASTLLAALGLYGVVAVAVTRRKTEIGLRMALGARASDVGRAVLGEGLRMVLSGLALALPCSWVTGRLLSSFLYEIRPLDAASLGAAAAVIVVIAALATWIPARRAIRVSPMQPLRSGGS